MREGVLISDQKHSMMKAELDTSFLNEMNSKKLTIPSKRPPQHKSCESIFVKNSLCEILENLVGLHKMIPLKAF